MIVSLPRGQHHALRHSLIRGPHSADSIAHKQSYTPHLGGAQHVPKPEPHTPPLLANAFPGKISLLERKERSGDAALPNDAPQEGAAAVNHLDDERDGEARQEALPLHGEALVALLVVIWDGSGSELSVEVHCVLVGSEPLSQGAGGAGEIFVRHGVSPVEAEDGPRRMAEFGLVLLGHCALRCT